MNIGFAVLAVKALMTYRYVKYCKTIMMARIRVFQRVLNNPYTVKIF